MGFEQLQERSLFCMKNAAILHIINDPTAGIALLQICVFVTPFLVLQICVESVDGKETIIM